jgi:hypothetical protein
MQKRHIFFINGVTSPVILAGMLKLKMNWLVFAGVWVLPDKLAIDVIYV